MKLLMAKCVLLGDCTVGKSAITQAFHSDGTMFPKNYTMSTGIELCQKMVPLKEKGDFVDIFLFDSAGKDVFLDMCKKHWAGVGMVVIIFDTTNVDTFNNCSNWLKQIKEFMDPQKKVPSILIGNKSDLEQRRQVSCEEGEELAAKHSMKYFECSAKANEGIEEPFKWLAQTFFDAYDSSPDNVTLLE